MKVTTILLLFFLVIAASCVSTDNELTEERKKELKEKFCNANYVIPDTVIHYELYSDSLVLKFEPIAHYNAWNVSMVLREDYEDIQSNNNNVDLGYEVVRKVTNNEIVITGFHISPDSTDIYRPEFMGWPIFDNKIFVIPKGATRLLYRKIGSANNITPFWTKQHNVSFDLNFLYSLSNRKEYDYCFELFLKESGMNPEQINSIMKK